MQSWLSDERLTIEQQIEIEGAWAPSLAAYSTELLFNT
jgi:hypothetical protein